MDSNVRLTLLEGRLDRLETDCRRSRLVARIAGISCMVLVVLLLGSASIMRANSRAAVSDEIRTRRIEIQNEESGPGIVLSVSANGDPCIGLFGQDGVPRALLCVTSDGAANLVLAEGTGEDRLKLVASKDGTPAAFFFDQKGRNRLLIGVNPDGGPLLGFFDDKQRPFWSPPADPGVSRTKKPSGGE